VKKVKVYEVDLVKSGEMNFSSGNSAYDQNVDIDFEMTALTALK
jgi:hypothetical protein